MERGDWMSIISMSIFFVVLSVFLNIIIWQPKVTDDSPGSQLVIVTDAAHDVTCYRFAYHDGIQCLKNK